MPEKMYVDAANAVKTELEDIKLRAELADPISIRQRNYELRAVARVTQRLADTFKWNNPRFRFDTFYEACGLDSFGNIKEKSNLWPTGPNGEMVDHS